MSTYLDHLPTREKEKIRKRMRSSEAYERLREKVKGPEDLEKELKRSERMAELSFALEAEPKARDSIKAALEKDIAEQGIEAVMEGGKELSPAIKQALTTGKFSSAVLEHPVTHQDVLCIVPEGNVSDRFPVAVAFSDVYATSLIRKA